MSKRVFDDSFKKMAVELSYARGAVKEVADELGIDPSRLSKWRNRASSPEQTPVGLTPEQQQIRRLQKELKEAQLERDKDPMLTQRLLVQKRPSASSPGETGGIRVHKGAPQPVSRLRRCVACCR